MFCAPLFAELNLTLPKQNQSTNINHASNYTSTPVESASGLRILRRLRNSGNLIEDPEINTWIRSIGNQLTANASHSNAPFYFVVSRNLDVNAFATPGGVVVINSGLILLSDTESELAAVLSHEIAHITQRHISRMIAKAKGNRLAANAALVAGLLASTQNPQAGQAILNTAIATMAHKQLAFGRVAEAEADRVGLRILASGGFDPIGMPHFLDKLETSSDSKYDDVREFLQNHPLTHKRVSDTQSRAKKYNFRQQHDDTNFLYMREKVRAVTSSTKPTSSTLPASIRKYSKALHLSKAGNYNNALRYSNTHNKQISEAILTATLLNKTKSFQETINVLTPLIRTYPGEVSLAIPLAHAYLSVRQGEKAWQTLVEVNVSEQTSLEYFEVKQEAARLTGRTSQAYHAVASKNIRLGQYKAAKAQLQKAVRLPGSSYNELQQMKRELSQLSKVK
jgi:predicted Zn-dependent protease